MATATMTSKGQITVPKEIRERLGLEQGDELRFDLLPNGEVRISPPRPRPSAWGALGRLTSKPALDVESTKRAIGEHLAAKHRRISRSR